MTFISVEKLLNKTGSVYKLVILASKRTLQLNNGDVNLVNEKKLHKLSGVALKEIEAGKISFKEVKKK